MALRQDPGIGSLGYQVCEIYHSYQLTHFLDFGNCPLKGLTCTTIKYTMGTRKNEGGANENLKTHSKGLSQG